MKTYLKPEAEIVELKFSEAIMSGDIISNDLGIADGDEEGLEP